jgi:hypothetical protein
VDSTNAAFIVADVVADVTLVALPARGKVTGLNIKHSVAWAGAAVTSMTVSVGDGTDSLAYSTAAFDIFQSVAATAFQDTSTFISTTMASSNIVAHFTSNTNFGSGSVTVLTFGSVDIDVCMVTLP